LHKALSEAMVRVSRADIAEFLPKVVEQSIPVPMTAKNRELYNYITMDLLGVLEEALSSFGASFDLWRHYGRHSDSDEEANRLRGEIMSRQLCLRMLCDHPLLLKKSADLYDNDDEDAVGSSGGSKYAAQLKDAGLLDGLTHSPKLDTVVADIKEILREDRVNKVVVFSFFKGMLKYLQDALGEGTCVQFHGGMNARRKDAAKQRFSNDPKCRVFLSSDAGGYGVDLPMANYLISFDLPWSAGKLDQRNARIIRLSSQFEYVVVQNYVIRGSLEERQYEMLMQKRGIGEAFIDGKYDKSGNFELTLTSLREFLIRSEV
jgi:SNF2 family DNA or RNA helicase